MNAYKWAAIFCGLCCAGSANSTTTGGVITFAGTVYMPASASLDAHATSRMASPRFVQVRPLRDAQHRLSSDALDYFATYAAQEAKLVTATYR